MSLWSTMSWLGNSASGRWLVADWRTWVRLHLMSFLPPEALPRLVSHGGILRESRSRQRKPLEASMELGHCCLCSFLLAKRSHKANWFMEEGHRVYQDTDGVLSQLCITPGGTDHCLHPLSRILYNWDVPQSPSEESKDDSFHSMLHNVFN